MHMCVYVCLCIHEQRLKDQCPVLPPLSLNCGSLRKKAVSFLGTVAGSEGRMFFPQVPSRKVYINYKRHSKART